LSRVRHAEQGDLDLKFTHAKQFGVEKEVREIFLGFMGKSPACKARIEMMKSPIEVKIVVGKAGDEAYCEGETVVLSLSGETDMQSVDVARLAEDLFFEIGNVLQQAGNKSVRMAFFKGQMTLRGAGIAKAKYEAEQMWPYFQGLNELDRKNVALSEKAKAHLDRHRGEGESAYKSRWFGSTDGVGMAPGCDFTPEMVATAKQVQIVDQDTRAFFTRAKAECPKLVLPTGWTD
jgi:hypothetical protein